MDSKERISEMKIEAIIDGLEYEIVTSDENRICNGCVFYGVIGSCSLNQKCPLGEFSVFKKKEKESRND